MALYRIVLNKDHKSFLQGLSLLFLRGNTINLVITSTEENTLILIQLTSITKALVWRFMLHTDNFYSLVLKEVWVGAGYLDGQPDVLT